MNKLDAFLFEKAEVFHRLYTAFEGAEERFWRQLGKELHVIVKDLLGERCIDTFGDDEYRNRELSGYVWEPGLQLDLVGDKWVKFPAFWFPAETDEMDTLALMGIYESPRVR